VPQNNGRGVRRGSAKRAPLLNPCLPARAGGEPPQWENPADKGVVRPAARSARTRPRRTCSIFMLRWGTSGPQTDRRAAPGPTRAGGVWLVQIPPASRSPRLARGSRYSERGRGGSVPQLPQAAPGCPQALLCCPWDVTVTGTSPRAACDVGCSGGDWTVRPWVFQSREQVRSVPFNGFWA